MRDRMRRGTGDQRRREALSRRDLYVIRREGRRRSKSRILAVSTSGLLLVGILLSGCILLGDPDVEAGLRVENRTEQPLRIFLASGDGREVFHGDVPPRSTTETSVPCGAGPVVARLEDGTLVARHAAFQDCDEWVISELPR